MIYVLVKNSHLDNKYVPGTIFNQEQKQLIMKINKDNNNNI